MSRRLLVPLFPDGLFGSDYYSSTAERHASPFQSATRLPHWLWCGKCKFGVAVNFLTWTELKWLYLQGGRVVQKVILSSISYGDMNQTNSMQTKLLHKRRWQWIHSIYNRNKTMLEGFTQVKQVGHVRKAGVEFQEKVEFEKKKRISKHINTRLRND